MAGQYTFTTFTPGEAEAITGVSTALQRDWRRREFLPKGDGHARFDLFTLAELLAMKALADRGVGPQITREIAPLCAAGIAWEALGGKDAYEGDHQRTFDWQPEQFRPKREGDPELHAMLSKIVPDLPPLTEWDAGWSEKADWLRQQIMRLKGYRFTPASKFIWWADGSETWHNSLDEAFAGLSHLDPKLSGPVIVLDLAALGWVLSERAGRPFVHVEFPADFNSGEIEPPIEYGQPVPLSLGKQDNPETASRDADLPRDGASHK